MAQRRSDETRYKQVQAKHSPGAEAAQMKYKRYVAKTHKRLRLGALLVSNKKQISNVFEIKFQPYLSM
jgi:hypothetical protein